MRLAVAGAGLIGVRHIEEVTACPDTELAAIVDPGPAGPQSTTASTHRAAAIAPIAPR